MPCPSKQILDVNYLLTSPSWKVCMFRELQEGEGKDWLFIYSSCHEECGERRYIWYKPGVGQKHVGNMETTSFVNKKNSYKWEQYENNFLLTFELTIEGLKKSLYK